MSINKTIFQTYKHDKLPLVTKWHIRKLRKRNTEYNYEFYDDNRIAAFIKECYGNDVFSTYDKLQIGAAKADFFRYAVLYEYGGIYLDIDSLILDPIDQFLNDEDEAVISLEANGEFYIQFALFYAAKHPFLAKTLEYILSNIEQGKHNDDVHKMTGPTVYTAAIQDYLKENPNISYREIEMDYAGHVKFSYPMSKTFLYGFSRKNHWKKQMKDNASVLKSLV